MPSIICKRCNAPHCDTDCGERELIYREHHRRQMEDVELDEAEFDLSYNISLADFD